MPPRLRWWREVLTMLIFYELYSLARNTQGSGSTSPTHAFRNARVVINIERGIGLYHEESIQRLFLAVRPVMKFFNVYYGTAHFVVTAGALMWLFTRHPDRYVRWRWTLASTTLLGLVGFVAFPLMPPRLITSAFQMGSYVDTLRTIGGLWNFEDGAIAKLSNQYAAMPSLHFAWSLWVCLALWPRLRSRVTRSLAVAHPVITLTAIVATANHYWLDAAAGAVVLFLGWLLGGVLAARAVDRVATWPRRRGMAEVGPAATTMAAEPAAAGADRAGEPAAGGEVAAERPAVASVDGSGSVLDGSGPGAAAPAVADRTGGS
jgi:hypothetical protein